MAQFRVETVFDHSNGMYFIELYYPSDSTVPQARTASIYPSHEHAAADAVRMAKEAFPNQPIKAKQG